MIDNILSLIIWIPLPALVLILLLPNSMNQAFRWITLAATGLQFALSLMLFLHFDANQSGFNTYQFQESVPWINFDLGSLGFFSANYELGVDGFNISLVLLAGLVMFIGAISSLTIKEKPKGYFSLYGSMNGQGKHETQKLILLTFIDNKAIKVSIHYNQ